MCSVSFRTLANLSGEEALFLEGEGPSTNAIKKKKPRNALFCAYERSLVAEASVRYLYSSLIMLSSFGQEYLSKSSWCSKKLYLPKDNKHYHLFIWNLDLKNILFSYKSILHLIAAIGLTYVQLPTGKE